MKAIVAALLGLIAFDPLPAQVLYGTLTGTVEDSSGAIVPNIEVRVSNEAVGASRVVQTNESGTFTVTNLVPGRYLLEIQAPGFRPIRRNGIDVTVNTVTRADYRLQVGDTTESVNVEANTAALQTDKADVHVDLGAKEITQLPIGGYRNYQTLINLVPGATPAGYQNAVVGSPGRALTTNVNGTTRNNNNTRLDGAYNMRAHLPHQTLYVPPVESIETVNISTNSFDAEQGFAGGAAVNVITKSGTNDLHGVFFENFGNSALNAKNFFYLQPKKAKYVFNTYGGTLGGPIVRNKLFFFGSWEGMRERSTSRGLRPCRQLRKRQETSREQAPPSTILPPELQTAVAAPPLPMGLSRSTGRVPLPESCKIWPRQPIYPAWPTTSSLRRPPSLTETTLTPRLTMRYRTKRRCGGKSQSWTRPLPLLIASGRQAARA